jgi:hypothetical protein
MGVPLFTWQRALIAAQELPMELRMTGLRIALDSAAASGAEVVVNDVAVAGDVGCSPRTVWRRVQQLLDAGWLIQTSKPTHRGRDQVGRRAGYRLTTPHSDAAARPTSSDTASRDVADDTRPSCANVPLNLSDETRESYVTRRRAVANDPAESSDTPTLKSFATTTPGDGTHSSRDITTAAAAGARSPHPPTDPTEQLPLPVAILASKLNASHPRLLGLRWDTLGADRASELEALIDIHGDQRLIDVALSSLRDPAPVAAQAFLATWRAMPEPGQRLKVVRERRFCTTHPGIEINSRGDCPACIVDARVGDR